MSDLMEQARELATHASEIRHLQDDMDKLVSDMEEVKKSLAAINRTLSEAKGGWKTLMAIGGLVSFVTGVAGFIAGYWGQK
jgi:prefoldin subunit 5